MSTIRIEDVCIWPSHIEGNEPLKNALLGLAENEIVVLTLGGKTAAFMKMKQGKNKHPTPGLKPACDASKDWWHQQFKERKGEVITIAMVDP